MLVYALALISAIAAPARGADLPIIDDLGMIDLRQESQIDARAFNYPGINGPNGFDNPDCLITVTSMDLFSVPDQAFERLRDGLQVADGDGVLAAGKRGAVNILEGQLVGRNRLVFYIEDLGKFVTGLRVTTRSGDTLRRLADRVGLTGTLALQVVRGCRVLGVGRN